jgi:hypothetical protein
MGHTALLLLLLLLLHWPSLTSSHGGVCVQALVIHTVCCWLVPCVVSPLQVHLTSRTRGALGKTYMSPGGCLCVCVSVCVCVCVCVHTALEHLPCFFRDSSHPGPPAPPSSSPPHP